MPISIHPDTSVTLYRGIPFPQDYSSTLWFTTKGQQTDFFNTWRDQEEFTEVSYQRQNGRIRVSALGDRAHFYNYLSFTNPDSNYRYYAFITDCEYINNNTYSFAFTIDVIQSFMHVLTPHPVYIDRQHVNNDTKGYNTQPEEFSAMGQLLYECVAAPTTDIPDVPTYDRIEPVSNWLFDAKKMWSDDSLCMVIMSTEDLETKGDVNEWELSKCNPYWKMEPTQLYGPLYYPIWYYGYPINNIDWVNHLINAFNFISKNGLADAIINFFVAPMGLYYTSQREQDGSGQTRYGYDFRLNIPQNQLGVYTPKNNKLYTYPYNYLYVTTNEGNGAIYKYEYFDKYEQEYGSTFFAFCGHMAPNCVVGLYPRNYASSLYNVNELLTTAPYPLLPWSSDVYQAYCALNGGKIAAQRTNLDIDLKQGYASDSLNFLTGGITTMMKASIGWADVSGLASPVMGMVNRAIDYQQEIRNIDAQMYDISVIPNQSHGNLSADPVISAGVKGFTFYRVYPNSESAKIIDDYFTMFGYHIGTIAIPNFTGRKNFNYVKVKGQLFTGTAPAPALASINQIFNMGITLYHNIDTYGDNLADNAII